MNSPPVARPTTTTSLRRDGEKQGRESEGAGVVRVFSENDFLVARLDPSREAERIRRLLAAPNATPVRKHDGTLAAIRLQSFGDDRGHAGECHGHSTVTTERVRNDKRQCVGPALNLKHKENPSETWRYLAVTVHLKPTQPESPASNRSNPHKK
jgi:hypothetical protein